MINLNTINIGDTILLADNRKVKVLQVYPNGYLFEDEKGVINIATKAEIKRKIRVKKQAKSI